MEKNELAVTKSATAFEVALTQSKSNPVVKAMPKDEARSGLMDIIALAYQYAGQVLNKTDLSFQCDALLKDVTLSFPFMAIYEVRLAFYHGVRKEYGDYFGLNNQTYFGWLKAYQQDARRAEALRAKKEAEQHYKPIMSKEQAEQEWQSAIQRAFTKYKQTGVFLVEQVSYLYERLKSQGSIHLTSEEYIVYWKRALVAVRQEKLKERLNPRTLSQRSNAKAFIERMDADALTEEDAEVVRQQARSFVVQDYFKSIDSLNLQK